MFQCLPTPVLHPLATRSAIEARLCRTVVGMRRLVEEVELQNVGASARVSPRDTHDSHDHAIARRAWARGLYAFGFIRACTTPTCVIMWLFCILLLVFTLGSMGAIRAGYEARAGVRQEALNYNASESNLTWGEAYFQHQEEWRAMRWNATNTAFGESSNDFMSVTVPLMIGAACACLLLAITGCLLSQPISLWCAGKRARGRVAVAAASDDGVTVLASHARPSDPRHRATRGIAFDVTARSSHDVCVQSLRLAGDLGKVRVFVLDGAHDCGGFVVV